MSHRNDTTDTFVLADVLYDLNVSTLLNDTTNTFVLADVLYDPNVSPLLNDTT